MITESGVNIEELKNKIINGEKLSEEEVKNIVYEDLFYQVDRVEGEDLRWTRRIDLIYEIDGNYYRIYYYRRLTERQENDFWEQEAIKVEKKPITIYEWAEVD